MNTKVKQFKDPVHGYIAICEDWCNDFVDTAIFQRLRYIEQTSMRPLYPAAHHDRFVHSLGTFHLAKRLLTGIVANTQNNELIKVLDNYKNTFLIASLMHDCGHAPFSHTFEKFYNYSEASTTKRAYSLLQKEFPNADFKNADGFEPAPHEAFSAVVLSKFYKNQLNKHDCDIELAARMITGCTYPDARTLEVSVANCLIGLLNGKAIDVDKLDYILRDTWASGVQNTAIDTERLLASVVLCPDKNKKNQLCFHKSALSVIQNVVDARNYLYEWVYNHHTVLYYSQLLDRSIRKLAKYLGNPENPDLFWNVVFSLTPFEQQVNIGNSIFIYLPTDGDMLHILKHYTDEANLSDVGELLAHAPKRIALWKTYAEFRMLFKGYPVANPDICNGVAKRLPKLLAQEFNCDENCVMVVSALSKHYVIDESHVHIQMDGEVRPFTDLVGERPAGKKGYFFYVFVTHELASENERIIGLIQKQER